MIKCYAGYLLETECKKCCSDKESILLFYIIISQSEVLIAVYKLKLKEHFIFLLMDSH